MKFLKIILLLILFIFIGHIGLHIYYMFVGIEGHWYNEYGREWIITEDIELSNYNGQSVIVRDSELNSEVPEGSVKMVGVNYQPYGLSPFGGRLHTSSSLQSDDIEYWYRCPFKIIPIQLLHTFF